MKWAGHVARMEDRRCAYRVLVGKPEGKNHFEDLNVDGSIILKLIFKMWDGTWTGLSWIWDFPGGIAKWVILNVLNFATQI
jgi:hypothetical protein